MPTINLAPKTLPPTAALESLTAELARLLLAVERDPPRDSGALSEAVDPLLTLLTAIRVEGRPPAAYFEGPDREHLFNEDVDAAVLTHLEEEYQTPEDFPETVTICRYRRIIPKAAHHQYPDHLSPLADLLLRLDEEHLDPCQDGTKPTEGMTRAERHLVETTLLEYHPHWYETETSTEIDVRSWLRQHRPDMLPIRSFTTAVCGHCHRPRGAQEMRTCTSCLRRGCSRCWRRAQGDPYPWPRMGYTLNSCGFRLPDGYEAEKQRQQKERRELHLGWHLRSEGPVHAD